MQSIKLRDSDKDGATRLTQVNSSGGTRHRVRHQVTANTKVACQLGSGDISAALGYLRSDTAKSTYGHANMCKGRGVAPARVTAARPVKIPASAKVMAKVKK